MKYSLYIETNMQLGVMTCEQKVEKQADTTQYL